MNKPVDHDLISVYTNAKQIVYETKNTDLEKDLPTECFGFDIPSLWSKECSEKTIALIVKEHNKVDTKLNVYREYRKKFPSMLKYISVVWTSTLLRQSKQSKVTIRNGSQLIIGKISKKNAQSFRRRVYPVCMHRRRLYESQQETIGLFRQR